jgi:tryptophan halogenase
VTRLLRLCPFGGWSESLQRQYNQESQLEYERIRDFIVLHYKATERDDTQYWRDCRDMSIPDTLAHRMEMYRQTGLVFPDGDDVFRIDSWLQVMVGQRLQARSYHHVANLLGDERLQKMLETLKASISTSVEKMPTHKAFLDQYCAVQK